MGKALAATYPVARAVFDEADAALWRIAFRAVRSTVLTISSP